MILHSTSNSVRVVVIQVVIQSQALLLIGVDSGMLLTYSQAVLLTGLGSRMVLAYLQAVLLIRVDSRMLLT